MKTPGAHSLPLRLTAAAQILTTPTTNNGGQGSVQANPAAGNNKPIDIKPFHLHLRKVVMQDGTPVPQNVTIQRVCSGSAKIKVAYTDEKGRFNFRWNDSTSVLADAADAGVDARYRWIRQSQSAGGGNPTSADPYGNRMMNCDLRAVVAIPHPLFTTFFNHSIAENPEYRRARPAGGLPESKALPSASLPCSPYDGVKKAYEHGMQSLLKESRPTP